MDNFYLKTYRLLKGLRNVSKWKNRKILYSDSIGISLRYYKEMFNYQPLFIFRKKGGVRWAFLLYNQQLIEIKQTDSGKVANECVLYASNIYKEYFDLVHKAQIINPLMIRGETKRKTFSVRDANGNTLEYCEAKVC